MWSAEGRRRTEKNYVTKEAETGWVWSGTNKYFWNLEEARNGFLPEALRRKGPCRHLGFYFRKTHFGVLISRTGRN